MVEEDAHGTLEGERGGCVLKETETEIMLKRKISF